MRVIGTAGHVDHGKSTLVKALTGINPDRLKEELAREMTIELGFAWMTLPSGQVVSWVDVPGHEAFIKNMLAGVGGIDAALLAIAADEGIMPQTREHLAILDLLRVKGGVVALTKTDLVTESDWLALVESEIQKTLAHTVLANATIVPVSAKTGQGLIKLVHELDCVLAQVTEKLDQGRPRLPIDRVFSLAGFGTVVTGTLSNGSFAIGDEVKILPSGLRARIRGIQSHKEKLTRVVPGGRVALNLAGVATEDLARGETVVLPGTYRATEMLDARVQWLASAPKPLTHNQTLELFAFASQVSARVRLLEGDKVLPGASGWAQLILSEPIVVAKGDRFILRYPSPSLTVGGGVVIEPHPLARHRHGSAGVIVQLERAEHGTPAELLLQYLDANGPLDARELKLLVLDEVSLAAARRELIDAQQLIALTQDRTEFLLTRAGWVRWCEKFVRELNEYHRQFPLRTGMPREEFKSRLSFPARVYEAVLVRASAENILCFNERVVWHPSHQVHFDADLQSRVDQLLAQFGRAPYAPPAYAEAEEMLGAEVLNALLEQGRLVKISETILLTTQAESVMMDWVMQTIHARGQVTAAELRDYFETSRKYAIAFLEYLDQVHLTKRVGDARVLR